MKNAIIRATSGISKALVELLLREGNEVGITGRREILEGTLQNGLQFILQFLGNTQTGNNAL